MAIFDLRESAVEEAGVTRKLAAILAADVVGYSRLMAADEHATLEALRRHRNELIDPAIAALHGRIVKTTGDGLLAEFPSVVEAVRCAAQVQRAMVARNADVPEDKRIVFRVGVNLGDVVVEAGDIFGDGVNVAARLEELCAPGEVLISGTAFDHLEGKTDLGFESLGEQAVKNIPSPVRTYRVLLAPGRAGEVIGPASGGPGVRAWAVAAAVLLVLAGAGAWWWQARPGSSPADASKMAYALPLPDKPSIAVLPFDNMSGDPEQAYFADGMAEDIITDLSRVSGLFVIARNSSFSYRGKQTDVRTIALELGVRYVLEGSVRRVGDQVRINAQLVDAESGGHLWAERYDGALADVFALQDKVTSKIVAALAVNLTSDEQAARTVSETTSPRAYDAFLQGRAHYRRWNIDAFGEAVPFFKKALALDPNYSHAHAALAAIYWQAWRHWGERGKEWPPGMGVKQANFYQALDLAKAHLSEAMRRPTPLAHQVAAKMNLKNRLYDDAITEAKRAVALDPGDADALATLAYVQVFGGEAEEAEVAIKRAMRLDPHYPPNYLATLGIVTFALGDMAGAAELLERYSQRNPEDQVYVSLHVSTLMQTGREVEARRLFDAYDGYKLSIQANYPFWPFKDLEVFERYARGWVAAGVCCQDELDDLMKELRAAQEEQQSGVGLSQER